MQPRILVRAAVMSRFMCSSAKAASCLPRYQCGVAVSHGIAHLTSERKGQRRVRGRKFRVVHLDVMASLADDLDVSDHGVLGHLVLHELLLVHVDGVSLDAPNSLRNVLKIVR